MPPCAEVVNHWWKWYPPVGVFIALVAVIAFLYPLLYDAERKISLRRKLSWAAIVATLVALEIRSTYYDRLQHDQEQVVESCVRLQSFQKIANELEGDIKQNQAHFDQTMQKETGILATAEAVGDLSKSNLENITGGNAFAYATPFTTEADTSGLTLHNDGNQVLSGISVVIERYMNNCSMTLEPKCIPRFDSGMLHQIEMGTLGAHQHKPIPSDLTFNGNGDGTGHFNIRIYAQNGQAIEEIWFRRSTQHYGYAYRFNVVRTILGRAGPGDFKLGEETFRTLKTVDWTEYSPSESLDGIHPYVRH